jgi:hypothetical protein
MMNQATKKNAGTALPHISIVIVNWNGRHFLKQCLDSVLRQTYRHYDVYLIDNASTDGSVEFVENNYTGEINSGRLKVVKNNKNYGFAEGNNIGIREAMKNPDVRYIATLNADTIATEQWLEKLVAAAVAEENVGMAQGKILLMDRKRIDSTGILFYRSGTWWDRGEGEVDAGQYDSQGEIFGVCAAAALYKREMLEEAATNGEFFDRDFFGYVEDIDLSIRCRLRGWKAIYVPDAVVYHHRGGTTGPASTFLIYHTARNDLLLMFKVMPAGFIVSNFPLLLFSQIGEVYSHRKNIRLILKAKLDALRILKRMLYKRKRFFMKKTKIYLNNYTEKYLFPPVDAVPSWL